MQTHPKYRTAYTLANGTSSVYFDSYLGPRTLDSAVEYAAVMNRHAGESRYTVEPIPGTEPRYWLTCCADLGGPPRVSSWHHSGDPLPWPEAVAAWQYALEHSDNPSHWRALVAA